MVSQGQFRLLRICTAIFVATCLPASLDAQSVCESILKSANYNQYHSVATIDQGAVTKANLCIADYSSATKEQQAQISASYGLFSGNAGASATEITTAQHNECGGHYGAYWFSQLNLSDQKVVSDAALGAVKDCIDKYAQGLKVEPTFSEPDERELSVHLTWQHGTPLRLRRISVEPRNGADCDIDGQSITAPRAFNHRNISPAGSVTLTCSRKPETRVISGETVQCYSEGLIVIDVTDSPATIPLFRHCNTDYLASRAAAVEGDVSQIRSDLGNLVQQVHGMQAIVSALKPAQFFNVSYTDMTQWHPACNSPAKAESLDCAAAMHRYCTSQGFAGGYAQENGNNGTVLGFVCVK